MIYLIGFFTIGAAIILQSAIVSQITLLQGSADLVLLTFLSWTMNEQNQPTWVWPTVTGLMLGLASALPLWVTLPAFFGIHFLVLTLRQQVWQIPILALFTATFLGTLVIDIFTLLELRITGTPIGFFETLNLIILPGILLNLFLAIPVQSVISEIIRWVNPPEEE